MNLKQVYDKRRIEGVSTIGIIRNGGYHVFELPVYEDGSFDCWHRTDLAGLRKDLERHWLVCSVPEGKAVSILGLASIAVEKAEFCFDENEYYKYLKHFVHSMNQKLEGLYVETEEQKRKWEKHRVSWRAKKIPFKLQQSVGYFAVDGKSTWVFYLPEKEGESIELGQITAYSDGTFELDKEEGKYRSLDEIKEMFARGQVAAEQKESAWFRLGDLGRIYGTIIYAVGSQEKIKEIEQLSLEITKQPTAYDICESYYNQYLRNPCEANRKLLKEAYEKVPKHERCYLGDMDTMDSDFIRIIYHPEQKREV